MTFLNNSDLIEEGDSVVVYMDHLSSTVVKVKRGLTLHMKYGALRHEFLIGKRYGTRISATAGYVYALRCTPHLWTRTMSRSTQILYTPDIATICMLLDARPGSVICESGSGSGSLSHAIATAIAPNGHLYTHDVDEGRVRQVESDLKDHGLAGCTTAILQDTCEDGFFVENACDGVFLDLPAPWEAIGHAKRAISRARGGRLVGFSPCIEQVQKVCAELERQGFVQIQTLEIVPRALKVLEISRAIEVTSRTLEELEPAAHPNGPSSEERNGAGEARTRSANKRKVPTDEGPPEHNPAKADGGGEVKEADCTEEAEKTKSPLSRQRKMKKFEAIVYPPQQPTHTGYLTSATLLPSLSPE